MAWLGGGVLPSAGSSNASISTPTTQTQQAVPSKSPCCLRCSTSLSSAHPPRSRTAPRLFIENISMALELRISNPGNSSFHPRWSSAHVVNGREAAMLRRGRCVITAAPRLRHHPSPSGSVATKGPASGNMQLQCLRPDELVTQYSHGPSNRMPRM